MAENKKVRNAQRIEIDGVVFRSKLEANCYKTLKESGLPFQYEGCKLELQSTIDLSQETLICLLPSKENNIEVQKQKLRPITYTPDFIVTLPDETKLYIEAKGRPNDVYPMKKKMILFYLCKNESDSSFAEVHSVKQMQQLIDYINYNYYV
jgi:hypothetical protein